MKLRDQLQISTLVTVAMIIIAVLIVYDFFKPAPVEIYSVSNQITVVAEIYVEPEDRININYATADELKELNGIGDVISQRIVDYRDSNGYFSDIYELLNVDGIYESLFLEIEPYIIT